MALFPRILAEHTEAWVKLLEDQGAIRRRFPICFIGGIASLYALLQLPGRPSDVDGARLGRLARSQQRMLEEHATILHRCARQQARACTERASVPG